MLKSGLKGENHWIMYSNTFPSPPPVFPFFFFLVLILFDKLSRYLGQEYISPRLIKLPFFVNVDVIPESPMWAAQVRNRGVLPYIKNLTENSFCGKYHSTKCFAPPRLLKCFTLLCFTEIAETFATPPSITITLYEPQIYK